MESADGRGDGAGGRFKYVGGEEEEAKGKGKARTGHS